MRGRVGGSWLCGGISPTCAPESTCRQHQDVRLSQGGDERGGDHNNGVNADAFAIFLESGRGRGSQPIAECRAESDLYRPYSGDSELRCVGGLVISRSLRDGKGSCLNLHMK